MYVFNITDNVWDFDHKIDTSGLRYIVLFISSEGTEVALTSVLVPDTGNIMTEHECIKYHPSTIDVKQKHVYYQTSV